MEWEIFSGETSADVSSNLIQVRSSNLSKAQKVSENVVELLGRNEEWKSYVTLGIEIGAYGTLDRVSLICFQLKNLQAQMYQKHKEFS